MPSLQIIHIHDIIWVIGNIYLGNGDENINWHEIVQTYYMTVADWLLLTCMSNSLKGKIIISKYYMQFLYVNEMGQFKSAIGRTI